LAIATALALAGSLNAKGLSTPDWPSNGHEAADKRSRARADFIKIEVRVVAGGMSQTGILPA
jgi:hypothetical protein